MKCREYPVILDSRRLNVAKGYCCLPLKANKCSLSENKENRGFSDSIMWGPVHFMLYGSNFRR